MSTTVKVAIFLGVLASVGVVIYFATQSAPVTSGDTLGAPSSSASGIVRSIGSGLTGIVSAIVGGVEAEEAAAREAEAASSASGEVP